MRFGVIILPDRRWSANAARWRMAEDLGFTHGWTYDHLGWRSLVEGPWFDPVPVLTAAATITTSLRLGTLVASPNVRHPVHFAREITALDDVSGGRISIGIGAGTPDYDARVLGVPPLTPRERVERFAEFVSLLDTVLTTGRADHDGVYYRARDARSAPGCVQQPRVPFVVAANGPRAIRVTARHGQEWVTTGRRCTDLDEWWRSVEELVHRFEDAMTAAGRDPHAVPRHLSLDGAPTYSLSNASTFERRVARAHELGFTDVAVHWPRESEWFVGRPADLEDVAARVMPTYRDDVARLESQSGGTT